MISLNPKNLREFNRHLFTENTFDGFLVPEAHFLTAFRTDIDGQPEASHGSDGDTASASVSACVSWGSLRKIALELVRGTEAPKSFSIVMKLPAESLNSVLLSADAPDPEEVSGLYLNIRYAREELSVTTGCSMKTFSLDKTWEKAWDRKAEDFLAHKGLI